MIKLDHDNLHYVDLEFGFEELGGMQNIRVALDHDRGRLLLGELAEYYAGLAQLTEQDVMEGRSAGRPEPELPARKSLLRRIWERIRAE